MEINCYWDESGNYLLRNFDIKIKGLLASGGTERIAWDPLKQQFRSWLFDSAGGYLETTWASQGDHWVATASGHSSEGDPIQATYVVTPLRDDAYHLAGTNRHAGGEALPDFEMTIVRRAPAPGEVASPEKNDTEVADPAQE